MRCKLPDLSECRHLIHAPLSQAERLRGTHLPPTIITQQRRVVAADPMRCRRRCLEDALAGERDVTGEPARGLVRARGGEVELGGDGREHDERREDGGEEDE